MSENAAVTTEGNAVIDGNGTTGADLKKLAVAGLVVVGGYVVFKRVALTAARMLNKASEQ